MNFLGILFSPGLYIPWHFIKQIPEEAKVSTPEDPSSELAVTPPCCPKDLDNFMATAAPSALELHLLHQPLWPLCHQS